MFLLLVLRDKFIYMFDIKKTTEISFLLQQIDVITFFFELLHFFVPFENALIVFFVFGTPVII